MSVSASRCRAERRAVGSRKREEGHTTQEKLRLTVAARRETAAKLVEGGMSQRQAAEALGVGKGTIQRDLDRNGPQSGPERSTKAERRAQRELERVLGSAATPTEGRGRPPDAPTGSGFWHWVVAGDADRHPVAPSAGAHRPAPRPARSQLRGAFFAPSDFSPPPISHHVRAQASGKIVSRKIVCSCERVRRFLPAIFR
jgi:hypothetical protein